MTEEAPILGHNETMRRLVLACTGLLSKDKAHGPPGSLERTGAASGQDAWLLREAEWGEEALGSPYTVKDRHHKPRAL